MTELREGEATWVCPWAWCKRNGGEEWCDKCELRVALAASQERERQLIETLGESIREHRYCVVCYAPIDAEHNEGCALAALDFTQTNGG